MLTAISVAFWAVFPLVCMIALGCFLRYTKFFNDENIKHPNQMCFKIFLPATLFSNIYNSDFSTAFNFNLVAFAIIGTIVSFVFLLATIPRIENDNKKRASMIQGIFRSNYIFFGLSVVGSIFGESGTAIASVLAAFVVPLYNMLSVFALEKFCSKKPSVIGILKGVAKNPLIISSLTAFAFVILNIKLPLPIIDMVQDMGNVSTPLALILIGAGFKFMSSKRFIKQLVISVAGKLLIIPIVFVPIAIYMGFTGATLAALLIMFASPTAVSSYTMAQSAGADHELAGQIVVWTTALSALTIFIWVATLGTIGLI